LINFKINTPERTIESSEGKVIAKIEKIGYKDPKIVVKVGENSVLVAEKNGDEYIIKQQDSQIATFRPKDTLLEWNGTKYWIYGPELNITLANKLKVTTNRTKEIYSIGLGMRVGRFTPTRPKAFAEYDWNFTIEDDLAPVAYIYAALLWATLPVPK
jgi:hypothetical protein